MAVLRTPVRLALAWLSLSFSAALAVAGDDPFHRTVIEHFDAWDKDGNGELSAVELDALVVDGSITGAPAAAVGVLKSFSRSTKVDLPPLTRAYFDERAATIAAGGRPTPAIEARFTRALRRISRVQRGVFGESGPTLGTCRQGSLGDCYFVSMVGGMVLRHPDDVRRLIVENADGSYTVSFPNDRTRQVPRLTDAQMALTSSSGNDGLWLAVLEKAYGMVRNDAVAEDKRHEETTDAIARGGSIGPVIRLLTAHTTSRVSLKALRKDAGTTEAGLPRLRERVAAVVAADRLAGVSSPKEGTPPGVSPNHAYAVIGFDGATDTVRLWNPHGNTFSPKGEPGLDHGYPTKGGVFDIPLKELVMVFDMATFESDQPDLATLPEP